MLDIVRAAESLALGEVIPPKSPVEHHENLQKTTTIVMSKHTLDTLNNPAVAATPTVTDSQAPPSSNQQQQQPMQVTPSQVCN